MLSYYDKSQAVTALLSSVSILESFFNAHVFDSALCVFSEGGCWVH